MYMRNKQLTMLRQLIRETSFFDRFKKKKKKERSSSSKEQSNSSEEQSLTQKYSDKLGVEITRDDVRAAMKIQHQHRESFGYSLMRLYTHGKLTAQHGKKPHEKRLKHLNIPRDVWPKGVTKKQSSNIGQRHMSHTRNIAGDNLK